MRYLSTIKMKIGVSAENKEEAKRETRALVRQAMSLLRHADLVSGIGLWKLEELNVKELPF